MVRGNVKEAVTIGLKYSSKVEELGLLMHSSLVLHNLMLHLVILGRNSEAIQYKRKWQSTIDRIAKECTYVLSRVPVANFIECYEKNENLDNVNKDIEHFLDLGLIEYYSRIYYAWIIYIRLDQWESSSESLKSRIQFKKLKRAMHSYRIRALTKVDRCHLLIVQAAICRLQGKPNGALKKLSITEKMAIKVDSKFALFHIYRQSAKVYKLINNKILLNTYVNEALNLCEKNGWPLRKEKICNEFAIQRKIDRTKLVDRTKLINKRKSADLLFSERIIESLINVNTVSSFETNPQDQIQLILEEILKIMNAERSLIYIIGKKSMNLNFHGGRSVAAGKIEEPNDHCSTLIKRVHKEKKSIIVTDDQEIKELDSRSAIITELKSMLAVPLVMRGSYCGVAYIDSSISRGLFSKNDVNLFTALANQACIAIDRLQFQALQIESLAMEKDLQIGSVVQNMLLPKNNYWVKETMKLGSLYQPATQCGGDWWWWNFDNSKEVSYFFVGDVTGHGVGPSMITAIMAGIFQSSISTSDHLPVDEVMNQVSRVIYSIAGGDYMVSGVALEIHIKTGLVTMWNAGFPPLIIVTDENSCMLKQVPGNLIGSQIDPTWGREEFLLNKNERLAICTDGLSEITLKNGKELGYRNLEKLLISSKKKTIENATKDIVDFVDANKMSSSFEDDITLLLIDLD